MPSLPSATVWRGVGVGEQDVNTIIHVLIGLTPVSLYFNVLHVSSQSMFVMGAGDQM